MLRGDLGLTGAKFGCGAGLCGACTVIVDRQAVRSCSTPVKDVAGKQVLTIEGLSQDGKLDPIQEAFLKHHAYQCGYCTPGMILNAYALLLQTPRPTEAQIVAAMDDNLCRCGAHVRIVAAIQEAAPGPGGPDEIAQVTRRDFFATAPACSSSSAPSAQAQQPEAAPLPARSPSPPISTPTCESPPTGGWPASWARWNWGKAP